MIPVMIPVPLRVMVLLWAICLICLPKCQFEDPPRRENYVLVKLNDSLKSFDSVQILILAANDTSQIVGKIWSGPLENPSGIPGFRLPDGEERPLAVRVRGFDSNRVLVLDMLIAKTDGKQIVTALPITLPSDKLISLATVPGALAPGFSAEQGEYTVSLAHSESTLTLVAVPEFPAATMAFEAGPLISGIPSSPIAIPVGGKTLSLKVTVGGRYRTYSLDIKRAGSPPDSNPGDTTHSVRLLALKSSLGILAPAFSPGIYEYVLGLAFAESTLTLTATPADAKAALTLNGTGLDSGNPSDPLTVPVGISALVLHVANGARKGTYTLNAMRLPRPPATTGDTTFPNRQEDPAFKAWKHQALVIFKYKPLGMQRGKVVTGFPLLIRLDPDNFNFSQSGAAGADIRFTKPNGEVIPFEIAGWDTAARTAEIWVKLDSIRVSDDSAKFRMYWGNANATQAGDPGKVFSIADGFSGAWHLSESATGKPDDFQDATGRFPGQGGSGDGKNLPRRISGVVGYGQDFQPEAGQGTIDLPNGFDPGAERWTFQVWLKKAGTKRGVIFAKGNPSTASIQRFQITVDSGYTNHIDLLRAGDDFRTGIFLAEDHFSHLSVTYDGKRAVFYMDGFFRAAKDWTQGGGNSGNAIIGSMISNGSFEGFNGSMDEFWFCSMDRSAEWVRMSYECQKPGSSLIKIAPAP